VSEVGFLFVRISRSNCLKNFQGQIFKKREKKIFFIFFEIIFRKLSLVLREFFSLFFLKLAGVEVG
jgi:hypothetical protein